MSALRATAAAPSSTLPDLGLPLTPDFVTYPVGCAIAGLAIEVEGLAVTWEDGLVHRFNRYWLRENAVGDGTINPTTRERDLDVALLPDDLAIARAALEPSGALVLRWAPDNAETRHHPGWLRSKADGRWHPEVAVPAQVSWQADDMPEPVSFDGPAVLADDQALLDWLVATRRYGLARLRGLPDEDGMVQLVAERIGAIRATSFGYLFTVQSKPNPDSNAYTAAALTGHTDLPTRETQPGLQLLHCRENACPDGQSTMADGFRLAEVLRAQEPEVFDALTTLPWVFTNRHRDFDYRWSGTIIRLDQNGSIAEIRYANALRADPDMAESDIPRAYRAVRLLSRLAGEPRFVCRYPFAPGDLVVFDNRRILHGRDAFDPAGGGRRLDGCYVDHDDLFSRLRVLSRNGREMPA